jgi:hypothetical protein
VTIEYIASSVRLYPPPFSPAVYPKGTRLIARFMRPKNGRVVMREFVSTGVCWSPGERYEPDKPTSRPRKVAEADASSKEPRDVR